MAIDMNVDVGSLIKGLFSKKESKEGSPSAPNPHVKTLMAVVAVVIVIASYVYFVYIPTQKDLKIKNDKIAQIETIRYEIESLSSSIKVAQEDLELAEIEYDRRTNLFHSDKELEDLYGQISLLAMQNKLMVTKIEKGFEVPIFADGFCTNDDSFVNDEGQPQLQNVGYYEFTVDLEISGNYSFYTNFRNGLAQLKKIININSESIVVVESEENTGNVKVTSSISTYRLPKNESEQCI
jgi:Tfp pilus assembly protein PilO|tara:strand:- start:1141 stop:1854 length:714 start_codon:yes stop_codon:yes gene_type:complete